MRKKIIIGNWKMHGSLSSIKTLCESLNKLSIVTNSVDVAVCVPNVYLSYVSENLNTNISLGIQNISQYLSGAYTGEISVNMLGDFNCKYVIIGHSERRILFAETNTDVLNKVRRVTSSNLNAIVCVGETVKERSSGLLRKVLEEQLQILLNNLSLHQLEKIIIAYEPVWAIGTGISASSSQILEVHSYLRSIITNFNVELAKNIKIIYGGSLKSSNADQILKLSDVDGGLIGGASLCGRSFGKIIKKAE